MPVVSAHSQLPKHDRDVLARRQSDATRRESQRYARSSSATKGAPQSPGSTICDALERMIRAYGEATVAKRLLALEAAMRRRRIEAAKATEPEAPPLLQGFRPDDVQRARDWIASRHPKVPSYAITSPWVYAVLTKRFGVCPTVRGRSSAEREGNDEQRADQGTL